MRMKRTALVPLVLGALAASSCSKESPSSPRAEGPAMVIRVAGMLKGEGGKT